jgi:hypothetical protein
MTSQHRNIVPLCHRDIAKPQCLTRKAPQLPNIEASKRFGGMMLRRNDAATPQWHDGQTLRMRNATMLNNQTGVAP